jgi:hypothetical protein
MINENDNFCKENVKYKKNQKSTDNEPIISHQSYFNNPSI